MADAPLSFGVSRPEKLAATNGKLDKYNTGDMCHSGLYAETACIWEVTARKPGNVHRERDFADVSMVDFLLSAAAIRPVLDTAAQRPVGATILEGVRATRGVSPTNTNLGIILLLTPLAAVGEHEDLAAGVERVLSGLDLADARSAFQAMRLARPGGLGQAPEQDVNDEPTRPLREIMALAADRDLIALQYANGFQEVFGDGLPALVQGLKETRCLESAIIFVHLTLLAHHPDSLIVRKRGQGEAREASQRAQQALELGWPVKTSGRKAFEELDAWLRAEGHGRNPGTTADLVTASLFAALRRGIITLPSPWPWSHG
jgi:triphosphoribosyl-dephospho-CoA synthase